jgi:hypothetical protein
MNVQFLLPYLLLKHQLQAVSSKPRYPHTVSQPRKPHSEGFLPREIRKVYSYL